MKWKLLVVLALVLRLISVNANPPSSSQITPPLSEIYHPVSTTNVEAQKSFNKGLTYIFAFNRDIAYREFEKASKLDPNLAMAYWGMALALGQDINQDVTPNDEIKAYALSQKALELSPKVSPSEQAYIKALVTRYTNNPQANFVPLRYAFRNAMKQVVARYPEDLDAATLYVESIMNLKPWKYWTWDGKPQEGTLEAVDLLESVLRRNPLHVGANHFNIHIWEESPHPERALISANRLTTLLPDAGHILHMPAHIYILLGDYDAAIKTNKNAIAADRKYIQEFGTGGEYPVHYLSHNLTILARTYMLAGQYNNAIATATELENFLKPHAQTMLPHVAKFLTVPMEVNLYFHRWKDVIAYVPVNTENVTVQTYWHFSRALAYINLGDLNSAQKEKTLMQKSRQGLTASDQIANNPATKVFDLAEMILNANLAHAQKQQAQYIDLLNKAVAIQDRLNYDEPPAWYTPIRLQLGRALLEEKRYKEAEEVFRKELNHLQRNGPLLFGLYLSLKAQGRNWDAFFVERELNAALRNSPSPISSTSSRGLSANLLNVVPRLV